jgi:translation initiation factor 1
MVEIDPITGLPKELGTWESITKESQEIAISLEKRKFGKTYTVVTGIDEKEVDMGDLTKKLKSKLARGGTSKSSKIELQGNHIQKTKETLLEAGFPPDTIVVK